MNKFRKVLVLITLAFVAVLLYITPVIAKMINPILKYNTITSMTSKTDLTINLSASGLSEKDKETFDALQPLIDNMRISAVSKMGRNSNRTLNYEVDINKVVYCIEDFFVLN